MPKISDSKDRMVLKTAELLQKQGYSGTGLKQIVEESGTPRGSLYFHFPGGKEELAVAALEYACDAQVKAIRRAFSQTSTAAEAMVTLVGMVRDHLVNSDFSEGCPIATVALEAATSEPLQRTCSKAFETWTVLFVERLVAEGYTPVQAGERVLIALTMIEGGLLLGRAHRSTKPLDAVSSEIRRVLEIQEIP